MTEKRGVPVGVAGLRPVEVAHRTVRHEQRRHRAHALDTAVRLEAGLEACAAPLELRVDVVAEPAQDGEPGRGCKRISRQCSRLVDGARRRQPVHDLRAAAERGEGQAAADDLAEDRHVRDHAVPLLRAAARDPETRDHLVEQEQCTRRVAQVS